VGAKVAAAARDVSERAGGLLLPADGPDVEGGPPRPGGGCPGRPPRPVSDCGGRVPPVPGRATPCEEAAGCMAESNETEEWLAPLRQRVDSVLPSS